MYLGIEIGGTKLQLAVGSRGGQEPLEFERKEVDRRGGAAGILEQIDQLARPMIRRHPVERIGIGFGGPVDPATGQVITSHQIAGWENVPLSAWIEQTLDRPCAVENDCNVAALAEASFGAGEGERRVFYVTVGSGVGGGLVVEGKLFGADRPAAAEIGHLRPGLHEDHPENTVESLASGWGIAARAKRRIEELTPHSGHVFEEAAEDDQAEEVEVIRLMRRPDDIRQADAEFAAELLDRARGSLEELSAEHVAQAASQGNELAQAVLAQATTALGWGIAQAITLMAPQMVVIGGGVSAIGEQLFFEPVREAVACYLFPPLKNTYQIVKSTLGEMAVVQGALLLAAQESA